ncbi:hypothetical protein [Marinisporobacter balticus]|uniref:Uncharacterized protein n=1 Tax=Marinisporobacter balticus TaxID=2018667 RepID=A0A4V2SB89_9FIRM|nr:hypothetical protein [Marinisporobacter balticus]TCO74570.1 hypothetical protein EV214_11248 [Marinisporobacter balticus]
MKTFILEKIVQTPLKKILDVVDFKEMDWIWINREIYIDILYNLALEKEFDEAELERFLNKIEEKEMIQALIKPFEKEGYIPIDQNLFSNFEKGYRLTEDIETTIFIKEKYYRKLSIRQMRDYNWILQAMAIDTYLRMGLEYKNLKETYEELYMENTRMIEDILRVGEYTFQAGLWRFEKKTEELYFYKLGEFHKIWAEGEVSSKFEELMKRY